MSLPNDCITTAKNICAILEDNPKIETACLKLCPQLILLLYYSQVLWESGEIGSSEFDIDTAAYHLKIALPQELEARYFIIFNPNDPNSQVEFKLSDNLIEIWKCLKSGLNKLDENGVKENDVVGWWRYEFRHAIDRHLVDSIRFLVLRQY